MLTFADARARIVSAARPTQGEELPLAELLGRVLVEPRVVATIDVPPFANSSMDGFAVRSADTPAALHLAGEVHAGAARLPTVEAGSAVRIMTGAQLPPGADAVVPIEEADAAGTTVSVPHTGSGAWVRPRGLDTRAGEVVELAAEPLSAAAIGVLASLGHGSAVVRRRPVVGILSTGDELVEPGHPLVDGQIYDANGPALAAAVREAGGTPELLPRAPDDPQAIGAGLLAGAEASDLLLVSGGVSVGERDHVRTIIERLGRLDLWRIAIQPGKPLAFGELAGIPVLGLPGNPVSALVTFELFGRQLIRAMLGLPGDGRPHLGVRAVEAMRTDPERETYLRVVVSEGPDGLEARPAGGQGSSQLRPLAAANALLVVPIGVEATQPGASYDALLVGDVR